MNADWFDLINFNFKLLASDVKLAIVAPSQNRSQAVNKNSKNDMDEVHSLGTSKGERRQAVSNESPGFKR